MAYSITIERSCSESGCDKRATEEVRNWRNEPIRQCCARHAKALVARLNESETGTAIGR